MDGQLNLLKESLRLLSLTFKEQREELPSFVEDIMTDITEDYINAFYLIPQLLDKKLLSEKALEKLVRCYVRVQTNYVNKEWSSYQAFKNHKVWDLARSYTKEALEEITTDSPNLLK